MEYGTTVMQKTLFQKSGEDIELSLQEMNDKALQKRMTNALKKRKKKEKYHQKLNSILLRKHFDRLKTFSKNKSRQEKLISNMSLCMMDDIQKNCTEESLKAPTEDENLLLPFCTDLINEDSLKEWEIIFHSEYQDIPLPQQTNIGFPRIWWTKCV